MFWTSLFDEAKLSRYVFLYKPFSIRSCFISELFKTACVRCTANLRLARINRISGELLRDAKFQFRTLYLLMINYLFGNPNINSLCVGGGAGWRGGVRLVHNTWVKHELSTLLDFLKEAPGMAMGDLRRVSK